MRCNFLNRFCPLILGGILVLFLSGWTWNPALVLATPIDETWNGTTSQGYSMSFIVSSSGTQWNDFSLEFSVPSCPGNLMVVTTGPGPITENQFSYSWPGGTFSFTGQFTSESSASGTYTFENFPISGCNDFLAQSGTWTAQAFTFSDVPTGYWAWEYIDRLYKAGITGGCALSPLQYCPETTVTRSQMAVFLERGIHTSSYVPPAVGGSTGFGDVAIDYWAAGWIKQLAAEGITGGCGSGNYCPEYPVTRDQMAVFLLRSKYGASYNPPAVGAGTGFGDVPIGHWAAGWIKQLVTEGITAGCGNGNYCPELPVTRAQMAVFLVRTFNLP